jgi:hypothetical protein
VFPGAIEVEQYLDAVDHLVTPMGFTHQRTFAAVSICRDELSQTFIGAVGRRWDPPFSLGGLGALPSLGRTGWRAALSHVPDSDGRGHLIVFGMPHIGIDADGVIGQSLRAQQKEPSPACGAMVSLLDALHADGDSPPMIPPALDDGEGERLVRLLGVTPDDPPDDLVELTRLAVDVVEREIWNELEALEAPEHMDVAVFCGIHIHTPDHVDRVDGATGTYRGANGRRVDLHLPL